MGILEVTLDKVIEAEPAERKVEKALKAGLIRQSLDRDWLGEAEEKGIVTSEEAKLLRETEELVFKVISVDHFEPEAITGQAGRTTEGAPEAERPEASQPSRPETHERAAEPAEAAPATEPGRKDSGVQAAE